VHEARCKLIISLITCHSIPVTTRLPVKLQRCCYIAVPSCTASEVEAQSNATLAAFTVDAVLLCDCCLLLLLQGLYGWQERELVVN
jgi:hypothetical protein